jgi:predicted kinase
MKELIIMIGIPGSGKSTIVNKIANEKSFQVVCRDDIRMALGHKYNVRTEPHVFAITNTITRSHMERGFDIVIDETNTNLTTLSNWIDLGKEYGYTIRYIIMYVDVEICKIRRGCSNGDFPVEVIDRMHLQLNSLLDGELPIDDEIKDITYINDKGEKCLP